MEVFELNKKIADTSTGAISFSVPRYNFFHSHFSLTQRKSPPSFSSRSFLLSLYPSLTALQLCDIPPYLCYNTVQSCNSSFCSPCYRGALVHVYFPEKVWKFLPSCQPLVSTLFALFCFTLLIIKPVLPTSPCIICFSTCLTIFSFDWRLTPPFTVISSLKLCSPVLEASWQGWFCPA